MNRWRHSERLALRLAAAAVVMATILCAPPAGAYSGMLMSTDGGILGTGRWIVVGPTSLSWDVTLNADNSWHYSYEFCHPRGETSHFILETSMGFGWDDILNPDGDFEEIEIGWQAVRSGNPNMPEDVYGIRFDEAWGLCSSFEFDSFRAPVWPVWGDFYSKNGSAGGYGRNTAWNAGFTLHDADPTGPVHDGSLQSHALVPDTHGTPPPIPEPSALLLLGSALLGMIAVRRKLG